MRLILHTVLMASLALPALAGAPEIVRVETQKAGMVWNFHVTVLHPDTGWEHYADGWEVLDTRGGRLGYRELMHPHVDEQPFTRSLSGVAIPDGTREVLIRARCSRDGWSDTAVRVELRR